MAPRLAVFLALLSACGPEKSDAGSETSARRPAM
jgi:hypothetical protein